MAAIKDTSRRHVLAATAAVLATGAAVNAAAIVAVKAGPHPDAELFVLLDRLKVASKALYELAADHDRRQSEYEARSQPYPEVARPRESDEEAFGFCQGARERGCRYGNSQLQELRTLPPQRRGMAENSFAENEMHVRWGMVDNDLTRAAEIVAAHDAWEQADAPLREELRLNDFNQETASLATAKAAIEREIMLAPAHTIEGLQVKARAALHMSGEDLDVDISDVMEPRDAWQMRTMLDDTDALLCLADNILRLRS